MSPGRDRIAGLAGLRLELENLYARYAAVVDDGPIDEWPELFHEDCVYKVIPRENFDRGLPLATMLCESKGMLIDRVNAIRDTSTYEPRALRHIVSAMEVLRNEKEDLVEARANFVVIETLNDDFSRVFVTGRYLDKLARDGNGWKFRERICVLDTNLIPNSLIYPI